MNIVIAPDSFKDCLSAKKVAGAIANGIKKVYANAIITQIPISDGGEGLLDALIVSTGGRLQTVKVKDPLLRNINAQYGILRDDSYFIYKGGHKYLFSITQFFF